MTRNVAFVSIFDLTPVFFAIARGLEKAGHQVFWITTDPYWTTWLRNKGVASNHLLPLIYAPKDFLSEPERAIIRQQIAAAERTADLTAAAALLADQFVAAKNPPDIDRYVCLYYRDLKRFLGENYVTHLFAEATNLNELIACIVCRELGVAFLAPGRLRYPSGRMVFFEGYRQDKILPRPEPRPVFSGRTLMDEFAATLPQPHFFHDFSHLRVLAPSKIIRSFGNRIRQNALIGRSNLTHHDLGQRAAVMLKQVVNGFYARHLCRYARLDDISGRVAFYPLHVQPEASIDVLGPYVSDQLTLIKNIRRALPYDITLVVKEHPNFLGLKNRAFFRALKQIPGVKLLHHHVSNFDIYRRAALVCTVSGTSGLEAGLLGIPAVTFSPMFYGGLSSVRFCSDLTRLQRLINELLSSFRRDLQSDAAVLENLTADSYEAFWAAPNYYPQVLDPVNIARLQHAFGTALEIPAPAAAASALNVNAHE